MPRAMECGWPEVDTDSTDGIGFRVLPCKTRPHHTLTVETEGIGGRVWHLCCEHRRVMIDEAALTAGLSIRTDEEIPTEIFAHVIWNDASQCWVYRVVINGLTMPAVQLKSGTYQGAKLEAEAVVKRMQLVADDIEKGRES